MKKHNIRIANCFEQVSVSDCNYTLNNKIQFSVQPIVYKKHMFNLFKDLFFLMLLIISLLHI